MSDLDVLFVCLISLLMGIVGGILESFEIGIVIFFTSLLSFSIIWWSLSKWKENKNNDKTRS